ncbi:uncharacterized protein JCM15063_005324 [Sporobolomyces koalae]|uniref:uncharacterized protein n=1 Tax=Sporobolomyces koalae TaxID=500713 RepID=UPI00316AF67E
MSYIEPSQVAALLSNPSERSTFLVIDVRSSDFAGGNLPGAINLTTDQFSSSAKVARVIEQYLEPRTPKLETVIVHCMRSQTRGPYVAHILAQSSKLPRNVEVKILRGGFQGWYRTYKGRKELFENLDTDEDNGVWEQVVEADEGDEAEAQDSRDLRQKLERQ